MAHLSGNLTKKLVENLGAGRHGDGGGLYLVVDPSGARRWIVRVTVKRQRNKKGAPLRTDFGLGGADVVTLNQARERALDCPQSPSGLSIMISMNTGIRKPRMAALSMTCTRLTALFHVAPPWISWLRKM